MKLEAKQTLQLSGLTKLKAGLGRPQGSLADAEKRASTAYITYVLRRFDKNSRGGGDWPKLSPATIAAKGSSAILVNTRLLRLGLQTGIGVVDVVTGRTWRLTFKFTSTKTHPPSGLSISDLASMHHLGFGKVPARKILVKPDSTTMERITRIMTKGCADTVNGK